MIGHSRYLTAVRVFASISLFVAFFARLNGVRFNEMFFHSPSIGSILSARYGRPNIWLVSLAGEAA